MSALSEISALISGLNIPVETGVFSGPAPSTYTVLVPISDGFDLHADNEPGVDIQEVRIYGRKRLVIRHGFREARLLDGI